MSLSIVFTLGLPMLIGAWFLFDQLLESGELEKEGMEKEVRKLQKKYDEDEEEPTNLLMAKWFKFGGGFYGLAALYTFIVIEAIEISGFILDFPGIATLFEDGIVALVVSVFVQQIMNFVTAMIWFTWWSGGVMVNFVVAYVAYYAGMMLAKEDLVRRWFRT